MPERNVIRRAAASPASPAPWMPLSEFRRALSRSVMPLDVTSEFVGGFRARIDQASRDCAIVAEIAATPHRATRTTQLINSSDEPYLKASLVLSGHAVLAQGYREAAIGAGDLVLYDSHRPYSLAFTEPSRCLVVALPQRDVGVPLEAIRRLTAIRLSGDDGGPARLAIPFLTGLSDDLGLLSGPTGSRLVGAASSMISALVLAELEQGGEPLSRRQDTFEAICTYIHDHLCEPDLSPADIADASFISVRKLYATFSARGTTVAAWIREQRLTRCRQALSNPLDDRPISAIASQWGYPDAPAFSRAYRTMFNESPSRTRSAAKTLMRPTSAA